MKIINKMMRLNGLIFFLPGFLISRYLLIYNNAAIIAANKLNNKQMKKLITIALLMLITLTSNAQVAKRTEFLTYVPMRTYHWDRSEENLERIINTEGGNFGLVFISRTYQSEKVYTEKHYGLVRNSFGEPSFILQQGVGYSAGNFNLTLAAGFASGYKKLIQIDKYPITVNGEASVIYIQRETWYSQLPEIFTNNGITPTIVGSISYTKYRVQPTLVLSPAYINGGIIIKLDSNE